MLIDPASDAQSRRSLLDGLRVIDLSFVFAMPLVGAMLADLGAEVIKIEPLHRLDQTRRGANFTVLPENEPGDRPWDRSGTFANLNRGKRSLALDLSVESGRAALRRLVKVSDVVIENYTPRVMRSWDMGYERLRELNPEIIMVSNTGFGHTGPWADYRVQGTSLEPMTGISHYSGYAGDRPWKIGQSYPDFVAAWHALFTLLGALRHRELTGRGQWLDLGMYQACVGMFGEAMLDFAANGRSGGRLGNRSAAGEIQGCYETVAADRWICLTVDDDAQWAALCALTGSYWDDDAPNDLAGAYARHDEVDEVLGRWVAGRPGAETVELLRGAGIAAGPVNDARDLLLDPHVVERGFYEVVDHPAGVGRRPIIGRPWRNSSIAVHARGPAPRLGQDNAYVLTEILGYSEAELASLVEAGVTGELAPVEARPAAVSMDERVAMGRLKAYDPEYRTRLSEFYGLGEGRGANATRRDEGDHR